LGGKTPRRLHNRRSIPLVRRKVDVEAQGQSSEKRKRRANDWSLPFKNSAVIRVCKSADPGKKRKNFKKADREPREEFKEWKKKRAQLL